MSSKDNSCHSNDVVIYGLTNRSSVNWWNRLNDYFIDQSRVTAKEKGLFFHSLQLLIASGVSIARSIQMLGERATNLRLKRILCTIAYDLDHHGLSFSKSLEKYPAVFSDYEVKMVRSGEISGTIAESLGSVSVQLQRHLELNSTIRSALYYPLVVLFTLVFAAFIILIFVVPQFSRLFSELELSLPFSTKLLIGASGFVLQYWWLILLFFWALWMIAKSSIETNSGKFYWDQRILALPVVGDLVDKIQTLRISNNFSALLKAGIPVNKILTVLAQIMPNAVFSHALNNIEKKVSKGARIYEAFRSEKGLDPVLGEVLEIGEKSGNISEVLDRLSQQYKLEVDYKIKTLTSLLEPLVLLLVGLGVGLMALAVILPLFQLQQAFLTV